jgi:hypothetical protein
MYVHIRAKKTYRMKEREEKAHIRSFDYTNTRMYEYQHKHTKKDRERRKLAFLPLTIQTHACTHTNTNIQRNRERRKLTFVPLTLAHAPNPNMSSFVYIKHMHIHAQKERERRKLTFVPLILAHAPNPDISFWHLPCLFSCFEPVYVHVCMRVSSSSCTGMQTETGLQPDSCMQTDTDMQTDTGMQNRYSHADRPLMQTDLFVQHSNLGFQVAVFLFPIKDLLILLTHTGERALCILTHLEPHCFHFPLLRVERRCQAVPFFDHLCVCACVCVMRLCVNVHINTCIYVHVHESVHMSLSSIICAFVCVCVMRLCNVIMCMYMKVYIRPFP